MVRPSFHALLLLVVWVAACAHRPTSRSARIITSASEAYDKGDFADALTKYRAAWASGEHGDDVVYGGARAASRSGNLDEAFVWLGRLQMDGETNEIAMTYDPELAKARSDPRFAAAMRRVREVSQARAIGVGSGLARSTAAAENISADALHKLIRGAEESGSSAVVILRNGKIVGEWYFGGYSHRIEAMSATKSIAELAILLLIADGKIASFDEPVWHFFPEWRQGRKQMITVRMLLNHTSGLQANPTTEEIYRSPNFVQLALSAELANDPGTQFFYNNKAVNLIAGIVDHLTGEKLDAFLRARLFSPLGIRDVTWTRDQAGNPHAMAGLQIHPLDFAKIGQMLLDGGQWQGRRILDKKLIDESWRGGALESGCGLLWWIGYRVSTSTLPIELEGALRDRNAPPAMIDKLKPYLGRPVPRKELRAALATFGKAEWEAFNQAMTTSKLTIGRKTEDPSSFSAKGYLGQYLVVVPSEGIVAVRMNDSDSRVAPDKYDFTEFVDLVPALVPPHN